MISHPDENRRRTQKYLLIITVTALALRLLVFGVIYVYQGAAVADVGGGDAGAYLTMAHYVNVAGELSDTLFLSRPFLFPALAGMLYRLTGPYAFPVIILNMILNVLTCLLVYRITTTIGQPPRVAFIAGLLAAVYPAMLLSSVTFMTEALFLFFFALSALLFARLIVSPNGRDTFCSAAVLGFATLTRLVTLLLPVLWVWLIVRRGQHWRRYVLTFLLIALLSPAILTFRNWYYAGILTFSTEGQWALLFMRATASERRATGEEPVKIYARYIQEIEARLGHPVPPIETIRPEAIWGYFQPSPQTYAVISQLAVEKNLAYPQWYILNSLYGLHRILSVSSLSVLPDLISIPLHYLFVLLACIGGWAYWQQSRRWFWFLVLPVLLNLALNVALQTATLDTRHGLADALMMFILAAQGIQVLTLRIQAKARQRTLSTA